MEDRCRAEVVELHAFFEGWFQATLPNDEETFQRVEGVLAEGFVLIQPDGELRERPAVLSLLRSLYGNSSDVPLTLEIKDVQIQQRQADLCLVTYEEWQRHPVEGTRVRLTSAWFRERSDTPQGVEWLHVHETWRPQT